MYSTVREERKDFISLTMFESRKCPNIDKTLFNFFLIFQETTQKHKLNLNLALAGYTHVPQPHPKEPNILAGQVSIEYSELNGIASIQIMDGYTTLQKVQIIGFPLVLNNDDLAI